MAAARRLGTDILGDALAMHALHAPRLRAAVLGLDREMIGTLQELMNRENNAYVRQRGERVLQFVNASQETY